MIAVLVVGCRHSPPAPEVDGTVHVAMEVDYEVNEAENQIRSTFLISLHGPSLGSRYPWARWEPGRTETALPGGMWVWCDLTADEAGEIDSLACGVRGVTDDNREALPECTTTTFANVVVDLWLVEAGTDWDFAHFPCGPTGHRHAAR